MKRLFLPFMMLCMLFVGKVQAQEELTVHDGTATSSYVPVYGFYCDAYLKCEMVYPADELSDMLGGEISSMTFENSSPASEAWTATFQVFVKEVDGATISAFSGTDGADIVYEGNLDGTGNTMTVNFTNPYNYAGGNLLVGFYLISTGNYKSITWVGESVTGASVQGYNYSSLDGITPTQRDFLPKTTFTYEPGTAPSCPKPKNLALSDITAHDVTVTWEAGGDETMWGIGIMNVNDSSDYQYSIVNDPTYTFGNLLGETQYQVGVVAICDMQSQDVSDPRLTYFTTEVSCPKPSHIEVIDIASHTATVTWLPAGGVPYTGAFKDFESDFEAQQIQGWTTIDADGDGKNWQIKPTSYTGYVGHNDSEGFVVSASYESGALTPDNYLVSPLISINEDCNTVSFWASAYSDYYAAEHFGLAVSTTSNTDASTFTTLNEWTLTAKGAYGVAKTARKEVRGEKANRQGAWYQYTVDLSAYMGQEVYVAIRHFGCSDQFKLLVDDIAIGQPADIELDTPFNLRYRIVGETTWNYINGIEDLSIDLDGLAAESTYEVEVQSDCSSYNEGGSAWTATTFTTDIACPAPTDLAVVPATSTANVTWNGDAEEYVLCYRPVDMSDMATIILTAPDIWQDGSGYQMLLDADATAYGTIIPETGALTAGGDVPASIYDEFEYKIPVNADGALTTQNMVVNNSIEIQVPAGVYDWCITNPTPGDRMWIAASNGNVGGRQDNYEFLVGQTYEFTISMYGSNDGVDVTISGKNRTKSREFEWECIDGITDNNYTLEGLEADTKYQVRVQAVCGGEDGESTWTSGTFTTLPTCPRPTDVTVTNITGHEATITWNAGADEDLWVVTVNGQEYEPTETTLTVAGLDPETEYTVEVVAVCSADDSSQPTTATFTTDIACPVPTDVAISDIAETTAVVTWNGSANEYVLCYRPIDPNDGANVTLTAGDIWQDGSGYQMLLDANATAYGSIIPETGALSSGGDVPASTYAEFEYKIPEAADGSLSTSNIVINNSVTITIPGGVYDWCITNPTPGDRMWIAAANGNVGGRQDDYEFENGMNYEFTISMYGSNDGVDVTVTAKSREYEWTCIDNITDNTFTLEDLDEATQYEVKVKAICGGDDGESDWTSNVKFTTGGDGISEASDGINVWNRTGEIHIDLVNGGNYTMNVVNILGQSVMTSNVSGQGSHIVKHNLTSGVYVVTLSSSEGTFATKIVVK